MKITHQDVRHVAALARLELEEGEIEQLAEDMSSILSYIKKLDELDTETVEPTSHVVAMSTPFREDSLSCESQPDKWLSNAPHRKDNFFVVPSIIE